MKLRNYESKQDNQFRGWGLPWGRPAPPRVSAPSRPAQGCTTPTQVKRKNAILVAALYSLQAVLNPKYDFFLCFHSFVRVWIPMKTSRKPVYFPKIFVRNKMFKMLRGPILNPSNRETMTLKVYQKCLQISTDFAMIYRLA